LAGGALLSRLLLTTGITALVVFKSLMNKNLFSKEQRTSGMKVTRNIFLKESLQLVQMNK
jgi:hypothetical protein